jgi:hypothetical protein
MTPESDSDLILDNGGAALLVPTNTGTRKLTFIVQDMQTLALALNYLVQYQKEHPDAV